MKIGRNHLCWIGALLLIVLIWQIGLVSGGRKFRELNTKIAKKEKALEEMKRLKNEYLQIKKTIEDMRRSLDGRKKDYTPLSFLERLFKQSGATYELIYREPRELKGKNAYMESSVGVELKGTGMEGLIAYLYQVESSNELLRVRNLRISPDKDGRLQVSFEVSTLVPAN